MDKKLDNILKEFFFKKYNKTHIKNGQMLVPLFSAMIELLWGKITSEERSLLTPKNITECVPPHTH